MAVRQLRKLLPEALIQDAARLEQGEFLERYGWVPLLLVRVAKDDVDLSAGLENLWRPSGTRRAARVAPMRFTTDQLRTPDNTLQPPTVEPRKQEELRLDLEGYIHFAAVLRGRGPVGVQRVSLGRAPNNGVVLRHPSVSKFHAWVAPTGEDMVEIVDPGSSNGTWVNGVRVQTRIAVKARSRDRIRFGSVETVLWSPRALWASQNPD